MSNISPLAIIEKGAQIADDVTVGAFCHIGSEVKIGPGCAVYNSVTISGKTTIGANNRLFPMVVVGCTPDETDQAGEVAIGKANDIREHVTIYAGQESPTVIGNNNLIMIGSQVGSEAKVNSHGIFANFTIIGPRSCVEDYVRTSGFTMTSNEATIGAYSFVAGYAEANSDIPPFAMMQGSPLRARGVNTHNLKRCGFGDDDIHLIKAAFRELFNGTNSLPDEQTIQNLENSHGDNIHIRRLVNAVRHTMQKRDGAND